MIIDARIADLPAIEDSLLDMPYAMIFIAPSNFSIPTLHVSPQKYSFKCTDHVLGRLTVTFESGREIFDQQQNYRIILCDNLVELNVRYRKMVKAWIQERRECIEKQEKYLNEFEKGLNL